MAFDPSGRSYAFCEYQVLTLWVAMSACEDQGPDRDYQIRAISICLLGQLRYAGELRRRTVAWKALFGFGSQPLVWDAKSQYTCDDLSAALVQEKRQVY